MAENAAREAQRAAATALRNAGAPLRELPGFAIWLKHAEL